MATIHSIHIALEKWPLFDPKSEKFLLAKRIFELVKDKWKQVCGHPAVSKHLDTPISIGHYGSIGVASDWLMGISVIEDMLERQARGLKRLTIRIDSNFSKDLSDFYLSDEVTIVTKAPLYGLVMTSDEPLSLEEGVTLIPQHLPSDEYDFLTAHLAGPVEIYPSAIFEHAWRERKVLASADKDMIVPKPLEEDLTFHTFVLVLRLVGMSNFGAPYVENRLLAPGFPLGYRQYRFTPSQSSRFVIEVDEITERESTGLPQAWNLLKQVLPPKEDKKTGWLAIALEKMNAACERDNRKDSLLDLCICLEALLTRERQQVTYQFRQRGTFLLSLGCRYLCESQLHEARRFLGDAYDLRSDLVHGNLSDVDEIEPTNTKLFELARIFSLKSIALSQTFSKDEIINKIDLAMASPAAREDLEFMLDNSPLAPFWNRPYEKVCGLFPPGPASPAKQESS